MLKEKQRMIKIAKAIMNKKRPTKKDRKLKI